jgi:hypothetical protein
MVEKVPRRAGSPTEGRADGEAGSGSWAGAGAGGPGTSWIVGAGVHDETDTIEALTRISDAAP